MTDVAIPLVIVAAYLSIAVVFFRVAPWVYGLTLCWIQGWFDIPYLYGIGTFLQEIGVWIAAVPLAFYEGQYTFPSGFSLPLAPLVGSLFVLGMVIPFLQLPTFFLRLYALTLAGPAVLITLAGGVRLFQTSNLPHPAVSIVYLVLLALILLVCLFAGPLALIARGCWEQAGLSNVFARANNWAIGLYTRLQSLKFPYAIRIVRTTDPLPQSVEPIPEPLARVAPISGLDHRVGHALDYDLAVGELLARELRVEGILLTGVSFLFRRDSYRLDNLLLCDRGVFIIEGKYYTGTILGNANGEWRTDAGALVKSSRGRNPLQQCDHCVLALKDFFSQNGYNVFVNGVIVFPDQTRFVIDSVLANSFERSTAVPVFQEQALIDGINAYQPPKRAAKRSRQVLNHMAALFLDS